MHILAGDIGGTNTRLRLVEYRGGVPAVQREARYASADFPDVDSALRKFLGSEASSTLDASCLAVAGPVEITGTGQRVPVTNLPWVIDSAALSRSLGLQRLQIINDFEAIGYGVDTLSPAAFDELQAGSVGGSGTRVVIGAGTGLGQAILVQETQGVRVLATEGGHIDFGPTDESELELSRWLIRHYGRATYERILSGPGLKRLYDFLRETGVGAESEALRVALQQSDPAAAITQAAREGRDPLAVATMDRFVRIYGAQAGNLALATGATGGVYVAGGMAPKMRDFLGDGRFMSAFRNKGKMSFLVASIPVRVIIDPDVGLIGAQAVAKSAVRAGRR